jgi:DNA-binding NtrC family response regulator
MPDPIATLLLISADSSFVESCRGAVASCPDLSLLVKNRASEADCYLARDEIKLILVHLAHRSETRDAVRLLYRRASLQRAAAVLVISERPDAEQAWSLTRLGATDYVSRPLDQDRLASLINVWAVQKRPANQSSVNALPVEGSTPEPSLDVSGRDRETMMEQMRRVAAQDTTILLGGETGTGKTRMARLIHDFSPRRAKPFLVINCGALAAELIESEMFGHVRGAFTGADQARTGKFAAAGQGTLLLDDIDALPLPLQAKLLRAVEERVFEPVGCNDSLPVEARLIAASNRPLEREVETGRFRADLFYRLNVVSFQMPPLREQPDKIAHLAAELLKNCASRNGRPFQGISAAARHILERYTWPGNIRELRNVIERAVALCPGSTIEVEDLPDALRSAAAPVAVRVQR